MFNYHNFKSIKIRLIDYKKLGDLSNCIYLITCPLSQSKSNGYIGKFTNIKRLNDYVNSTDLSFQPKLFNSIKRHSVENHYIEIIKCIPNSEGLVGLEKLYIQMYDTFKNGLNCTLGGQGHLKYSNYQCQQIYLLNKDGLNFSQIGILKNTKPGVVINLIKRVGIPVKHKRTMSSETRKTLSNKNKNNLYNLGKHHSQTVKNKMSILKTGIPSTSSTKFKDGMHPHNKGKLDSIPTVALDQNGVYQLVYPKFFQKKRSEWHRLCSKLAYQNYDKNKK